MDLNEELNAEQREAVLHADGPLLVLAGAGSGKTRVITYRIANLICNHQVRPTNILAVTFTNKAALEMKERVERLVGHARGIWISTFHAFGVRVLKEHAALLGGWDKNFVIYDEDDSQRLGSQVLREMDVSKDQYPVDRMLRYVEKAKHRLQNPDESNGRTIEKAFYFRYQQKLEQANAFDFSDLIHRTYELFAQQPEVLMRYRQRFHHILVDEFQDTDRAQYRILQLLCPMNANLCVVGDDDQSIYTWRDADVSHILGFQRDYPSARVVKLERNYRSTGSILKAAGSIISRNRNRHEKTLWTNDGLGDPVIVRCLEDEREESHFVAREILSQANQAGSLSNTAVLYRINAQSRVLEEAFRLYGLPYRIVGGTRFYDRAEIRDLLAYLRLINNPKSDLDLIRIINVPPRGIGAVTKQRLMDLAAQHRLCMYEILTPELLGGVCRTSELSKVLRFRKIIEEVSKNISEQPVDVLIRRILDVTGYVDYLGRQEPDSAIKRIENLQELQTAAMEYHTLSQDASLDGFLQHVSLVSDIENLDDANDLVNLMTLHAAKGLEFDQVFVIGMEEGLLPYRRALEFDFVEGAHHGGVEEERRLCYVGMTRARKRLHLSCARSRTIFGKWDQNPPSRFLADLAETDAIDKDWMGDARLESRWDEDIFDADDSEFALDSHDEIVVDYDEEYSQLGWEDQRPRSTRSWVGTMVEHASFGRGEVIEAQCAGEKTKLRIMFESVGEKKVFSNYVKPIGQKFRSM